MSAWTSRRGRISRTSFASSSTDSISTTSPAVAGVLETREVEGRFEVEFENGDDWNVEYTNTYEAIDQPFLHLVRRPRYRSASTSFSASVRRISSAQQRPVSGWLSAGHGSFWNGTRTDVGYRGPRRAFVEAVTRTAHTVRLGGPADRQLHQLAGGRRVWTYTLSPRTFVGALVQYNSGSETVSTKVSAPLGIRAWQRSVRRLQRRAGHRDGPGPAPYVAAAESWPGHQDDSALAILTRLSPRSFQTLRSTDVKRLLSLGFILLLTTPALAQVPSTQPDTPFKLATFEAGGTIRVGPRARRHGPGHPGRQ